MQINDVKNNVSSRNSSQDIRAIRTITWQGLMVNVLLSIIKFIFGFIGHSQAVIADAVHSLSDLTTDIAVLVGVAHWSKPADEAHPYGHKRLETLITSGISFFLILVAVGIGYKALVALKEGAAHQPGWIAFWGAFISVISKEVLYRQTVAVGKRERSPAVIANAWHHRTDSLSSLPVAVAVAIAAVNPRWAFLDNIGALGVSLFILYVSVGIIRSVVNEFMEQGVSAHEKEEIRKIVLATGGVRETHAIRTRRMGSDLHIDLHVLVDACISVQEGHDISRSVKSALIKKMPDVVDVIIHIEPFGGC